MKHQKSGSALLLVVLVLSAVLIYVSSGWYTTQTVVEIVTNKKRMFEAYYTTKSLSDYAVAMCCNNYNKLVKAGDEKEFTLDSSQWPFKNKKYSAKVNLLPLSDTIKITVKVENDRKTVQQESCLVSYAVHEEDVSKSYFVVKVV